MKGLINGLRQLIIAKNTPSSAFLALVNLIFKPSKNAFKPLKLF